VDETSDPNVTFGAIRALMQEEHGAPKWRARALGLLRRAHASHPVEYREQWVPYLAGFTAHWGEPLATLTSVGALHTWHEITPFARFELELDRQGEGTLGDDAQWRALPSREALSMVSSLAIVFDLSLESVSLAPVLSSPHATAISALRLWSCRCLGDRAAVAIADSPIAPQLTSLDIQLCGVGGLGARALARSESLSQLTRLVVRPLTDEARQVFERSSVLAPGVCDLRERPRRPSRRTETPD